MSREKKNHPTPSDSAGMTSPRLRRATVMDVARKAEVSASAVSKVVRGAYGVSPAMRDKVTAAIEELGYRPHGSARAMRGRSYTIGVVVAGLDSPFQIEVANSIANELDGTPYQEVIVSGGTNPERQSSRVAALLDRQVDGLIMVAPWLPSAVLEELGKTVPMVAVALHGSPANFDTVVDDEYLGARLVVDHLYDAGHRRIFHTSMPSIDPEGAFELSHVARRHGFEQAMRRHGLVPEVVETFYSEPGGYAAAEQMFAQRDKPTAVFAGADVAALGVLRFAEEHGIGVPEALSVVGYDNIYMSTINRVSLTTVDESGELTGQASTRLLLERIAGRTDPKQYIIAPRLITRGTSGPAPREKLTRNQQASRRASR